MNKPVLPEDESQEKYLVPGLERGLRLLCEFSRQDKTLSAPELARRLDVPRSTVFRLLTTLERMGFVERNDGGRDYRLGMAVLRLGFEYLASLELTEIGRPLLDRLRDEIGYSCNLVVRDGRSIVYVAKSVTQTAFASHVNVGTRLPAHATVLGRVLLEDLTLAELRELYPKNTWKFSPAIHRRPWSSCSTWCRTTRCVVTCCKKVSSKPASPPSPHRCAITRARWWPQWARRFHRRISTPTSSTRSCSRCATPPANWRVCLTMRLRNPARSSTCGGSNSNEHDSTRRQSRRRDGRLFGHRPGDCRAVARSRRSGRLLRPQPGTSATGGSATARALPCRKIVFVRLRRVVAGAGASLCRRRGREARRGLHAGQQCRPGSRLDLRRYRRRRLD